jgi:hypothetical protein
VVECDGDVASAWSAAGPRREKLKPNFIKKKEAEAEASYRFFFTGFCVPLDPHAGYEDLRPVSRIFFPRVVWQKQT